MIVSTSREILIGEAAGGGFVVQVTDAHGLPPVETCFHSADLAARHVRRQLLLWGREGSGEG